MKRNWSLTWEVIKSGTRSYEGEWFSSEKAALEFVKRKRLTNGKFTLQFERPDGPPEAEAERIEEAERRCRASGWPVPDRKKVAGIMADPNVKVAFEKIEDTSLWREPDAKEALKRLRGILPAANATKIKGGDQERTQFVPETLPRGERAPRAGGVFSQQDGAGAAKRASVLLTECEIDRWRWRARYVIDASGEQSYARSAALAFMAASKSGVSVLSDAQELSALYSVALKMGIDPEVFDGEDPIKEGGTQ